MKKMLFLVLCLIFASCKNTQSGKGAETQIKKHNVIFSVSNSEGGTLVAQIKSGKVLSSSPSMVEEGKTIVFVASPSSNEWKVEKWLIDGKEEASENGKTSIEIKVEKDVSVMVTFKKASPTPPPQENVGVTFSVKGEGGKIKARVKDGNELSSSPASVKKGSTIIFTATPDADYKFEKWIKDGVDVENNTTETYQLTVDANVEVNVKFYKESSSSNTYDENTGIGKVGDVSFMMIKIGEVNEAWLGYEKEKHKVSLSSYWIGEAEVTQKLWQEVMKENTSFFDDTGMKNVNGVSCNTAPENNEVQENRPVEQITWFNAIVFCNELTKKIGLGEAECVYYSDEAWTKVYTKQDAQEKKRVFIYKTAKDVANMSNEMNKKGFRLPTEAEWEWASMGGEGQTWAGTNEESNLGEYAWLNTNSNKKTHEVKKKSPNSYKLYDMTGNVMEWCWDLFGAITKDSNLGKNPLGALSGIDRTSRGGSFMAPATFLIENKVRGKLEATKMQRYLGMRLAKGN